VPSQAHTNNATVSGDITQVPWAQEFNQAKNVGWPIRINKLHNCMNEIEVEEKLTI